MRHFAAVALAVLAVAAGLVLALGEEEAGEDTTSAPAGDARPRPPRPEPAPAPPPAPANGHDAARTAGVERAVERYIEAAEAGEVAAPRGLPTTDELSIAEVRLEGSRATARLAGGERLLLRRSGGGWRVTRALSVR